jgi:hypothetical protein
MAQYHGLASEGPQRYKKIKTNKNQIKRKKSKTQQRSLILVPNSVTICGSHNVLAKFKKKHKVIQI